MPIRKTLPALTAMLVMLTLLVTVVMTPTQAQENLLQNPGFEDRGSYVNQAPGGSTQIFSIAPGWNGWQTNTPSTEPWMNIDPIGFPHSGNFKREGAESQNIGRGDGTFTAALYQNIGGVSEGTTFRFSTWVFQDNSSGNGARTRVGIGSNVGGNPLGSPITWSEWMTAVDSWQQVQVETTVPAGSISVFIYSTQLLPSRDNQNYYDDASLVIVGEGEINVGEGSGEVTEDGEVAPPPPPTSTPQTFAPFVSAQGADDSGRVVHTVQSGDTLAAIAVAYGVPASEILELNGLTRDEARFLRLGQQLLISEGSPETASADADEADDENAADEADEEDSDSGFASPTPNADADEAEDPTPIPSPTPLPETDEEDDEASAQEEADDSEEETVEEEEPTPDVSPTPTEIPATPTDAPPAPVEQGEDADPLAIDTGVCALMFDDANANTIRDGEDLLSGGVIELSDSAGALIEEYVTDGSEPYCFEELAPGNYQMRATAPDGFGLASSTRAVNIQAGQAFTVSFGAIEGLEVAAAPTEMPDTEDTETEIIEEPAEGGNNLRNLAGILVLGLAAVVLIGGIAVGVVVGRN